MPHFKKQQILTKFRNIRALIYTLQLKFEPILVSTTATLTHLMNLEIKTYWMQSIMRITKWYSLPSLILFVRLAIKSSFGLCSGLGQTRWILTCPAYSGHKQFNKFQMIYFPSFERELRYWIRTQNIGNLGKSRGITPVRKSIKSTTELGLLLIDTKC